LLPSIRMRHHCSLFTIYPEPTKQNLIEQIPVLILFDFAHCLRYWHTQHIFTLGCIPLQYIVYDSYKQYHQIQNKLVTFIKNPTCFSVWKFIVRGIIQFTCYSVSSLDFLLYYSNIKTRHFWMFKVVYYKGDYNSHVNDRVYTRHVVCWFYFHLHVAGCHTERFIGADGCDRSRPLLTIIK
jgi:hypothetical protein